MVAAGVRMDYPAFDVSQCSIYQRRSRFSFPVADPFEPVCIPRCKPARNRFLVLSQDVNRKEGAFLQVCVHGSASVYTDEHKWWLE
jgi:hypothetical protein